MMVIMLMKKDGSTRKCCLGRTLLLSWRICSGKHFTCPQLLPVEALYPKMNMDILPMQFWLLQLDNHATSLVRKQVIRLVSLKYHCLERCTDRNLIQRKWENITTMVVKGRECTLKTKPSN